MRTLLSTLFLTLLLSGSAIGQSLIDAARKSDREGLRALLAKKVDVNTAQPDGTTALHWAAGSWETELTGPRGIQPKYLSASATTWSWVMSPTTTRAALLGM